MMQSINKEFIVFFSIHHSKNTAPIISHMLPIIITLPLVSDAKNDIKFS